MTGRLNRASGLFAQSMVLRLLDHEAAQAFRHHTPMAVIRLSLGFEAEPDEATARRAHQELAQILNSQLRAVDLPGHLENDYLIVLPVTTEAGAHALAGRLAAAVAAFSPTRSPRAGACVGLAHSPGGPECDGNALADQATLALRAAQRAGLGSVVRYSELADQ